MGKRLIHINRRGNMLARVLLIAVAFFGFSWIFSYAPPVRSADLTDRYLLPFAAPNRSLAPGGQPNVLFIVVDDLNVAIGAYLDSASRRQYMSARTPNIDRLAAEGIRFDRAYVQIRFAVRLVRLF